MRHYARDLDEGIIFGPFESEQEAKQVADDINGIVFDESIFREKEFNPFTNPTGECKDGDYIPICLKCGDIRNAAHIYCPICGTNHCS